MILAGDIGGTNTRLALFDDELLKKHEQMFVNQGREGQGEQGGLTEIVREFLGAAKDAGVAGKVERATFGVAGPVKEGRASMTNLPWKLDERELARELKIAKVALINDLVAHGEGIELLRPEQLITIQAGEVVHGNRAVIAAGTGLGEGGIFWDSAQGGGGRGRYRAFASEGGHSDFAPRDDRQIALLRFLREKYPNASWERVLSGPGLRNIYEFLVRPDQLGPSAALVEGEITPSKISEAGMKGTNAACVEALELFVAFYGAEAANLALKVMATGGVYLGGGIAPNIVAKLNSATFIDAFLATGPQNIREILRKIPIHLVNFELNGLYGAANFAAHL
ncbi:MAG: glucokinase [Phycisphaerales bacterium]|nr:glucokinase [Phycisphaerales bacterium]